MLFRIKITQNPSYFIALFEHAKVINTKIRRDNI